MIRTGFQTHCVGLVLNINSTRSSFNLRPLIYIELLYSWVLFLGEENFVVLELRSSSYFKSTIVSYDFL